MQSIIDFLKGKKSYIVASGVGITVALGYIGFLDSAAVELALGALGAGGLAAVAAKIDRGNAA